MKYFIFDTDIGCDCDDAGALAMFHYCENRGQARLLAVNYCTSSPYGAGSIDAINRYYGRGDIPVGTVKHAGFMDEEKYYYYGRELCAEYPNRYPTGESAPDRVEVFRRALRDAPGGATVVATGPLHNFPAYLQSPPDEISPLTGAELIRDKVEMLVVMGGYFPENGRLIFADGNEMGAEFNIVGDIPAAQYTAAHWPGAIVFTGFEVGYQIETGQKLLDAQGNENPVRRAYELFCGGSRYSWDQTAVLFAAEGDAGHFKRSPAGRVTFGADGVSRFQPEESGPHYYLIPNAPRDVIAAKIDEMMMEKPTWGTAGTENTDKDGYQ